MKLLQTLIVIPSQRRKFSTKPVLSCTIGMLRAISSSIIQIELKDILNILQIVSFLRTLTIEEDSSMKLSESCLNFFIKINFSEDLIISQKVREISYLLLHVLGSWSFSIDQYEGMTKILSGKLEMGQENIEDLLGLIRLNETTYVSNLNRICDMYSVIKRKFDRNETGFSDLSFNSKLSYLIFYLLKMLLKICRLRIQDLIVDNQESIKLLCKDLVGYVKELENINAQSLFVSELTRCFKLKENCIHIMLVIFFYVVQEFEIENLEYEVWDELFDSVLEYISRLFDWKKRKVNSTVEHKSIKNGILYIPIS